MASSQETYQKPREWGEFIQSERIHTRKRAPKDINKDVNLMYVYFYVDLFAEEEGRKAKLKQEMIIDDR